MKGIGEIMPQYIVIYDRKSGEAHIREFKGEGASDAALAARFDAERHAKPNEEIASLTASSIDELRRTHSRYFQSSNEMFDSLEKLLAS